jgi:hypothetical protein
LDDDFYFRNDKIIKKTKIGQLKKWATKKGVWYTSGKIQAEVDVAEAEENPHQTRKALRIRRRADPEAKEEGITIPS